jgi:hypothetical protein
MPISKILSHRSCRTPVNGKPNLEPRIIFEGMSNISIRTYDVLGIVWFEPKLVHVANLINKIHIVHCVHCYWLTNCYSTHKFTVPLLCNSLLISCYVFRLNCHHHGDNTCITVLSYSSYACQIYRLYLKFAVFKSYKQLIINFY